MEFSNQVSICSINLRKYNNINSKRMRRLSDSTNIINQVTQLRVLAEKQFKQNLQKYNKLKERQINLGFSICIPTISKITDMKPNEFNKEKLYLQGMVNKMMKDEELLIKAQRKQIYEIQSQNQEKKQVNDTIYKSYNYLRKAWTQFMKQPNEPTDDHLDRLNKTVAMIKGNLQKSLSSIKNEQVQLLNQEELLQCSSYKLLLSKYEHTHMILEDITQKYQRKIIELQKKNKDLTNQNILLHKQLHEAKSKQAIISQTPPATRPSILSPVLQQSKPVFQSLYFQIKLLKVPSDDMSSYTKAIEELKLFVSNFNISEETLKQQRAMNLRNLHQFARSQDITKVRFQKTKMNLVDQQKLIPGKFYTKIGLLKTDIPKLM